MISYTGDAVTDMNLTRLFSACSYRGSQDLSHATALQTVINRAKAMLPEAVDKHFRWPVAWSRFAAHDAAGAAVRSWIGDAVSSLEAGLEEVLKDPALAAAAKPDLSDRPRSRGEQVEAAIDRFKAERTGAAMGYLLDSLQFTPLAAQGRTVEKAYRRKGQPNLAAELHRLWAQTWSLHGLPATGRQE